MSEEKPKGALNDKDQNAFWKLVDKLSDALIAKKPDLSAGTYYTMLYETGTLYLNHNCEKFNTDMKVKDLLKMSDKKLASEIKKITQNSLKIITECEKRYKKKIAKTKEEE